jgi:HSP20 family protein
MSSSLIPTRLLSLPSIWDEAEDWLSNAATQTSGLSVSEDESHVYVEAAVPGIDPKDVEVTFQDGYIWIRGESKQEEEDKKKKFYRRASSSFSYRVAVPGELDPTKDPDASYKHGVMKVSFAKLPKVEPKKITVKVSE